jgi:hypothetical protein
MAEVVAACLWRISRELILALDDRFGEPVDGYRNGAQVWLRDDGPGGAGLEWRLHPVAGFRQPDGVSHHDLLELVAYALRTGEEPPAAPEALWDGLEAFPAYGDEVEPAPLAGACTAALGIAPDAFGVVDHDQIGDEYERSRGRTSIVKALEAQLGRSGA